MKIPRWYWLILVLVVGVTGAVLVGTGLQARQALEHEQLGEARSRIEQVRRLTTTSYRYRDVVYFAEATRILGIPAADRELLFSIEIAVDAGVDLSAGFELQVDDDDRVFVTLPAASILQVDADERSIDQHLVREGLGGIDWLDVADEVERAKERNRADAVERGILEQAERQAEIVIANLLRGVGYQTVEVRFRGDSGELRG